MEERISNELRELALINKKRLFRNPQSGRSNRYTKEQKLAIVEAHVKEHLPINEFIAVRRKNLRLYFTI